MLGEGIVSLGVAVVTAPVKNRKASAKMVSPRWMRSSTRGAAGVNFYIPSALRNFTLMLSWAFSTTPNP